MIFPAGKVGKQRRFTLRTWPMPGTSVVPGPPRGFLTECHPSHAEGEPCNIPMFSRPVCQGSDFSTACYHAARPDVVSNVRVISPSRLDPCVGPRMIDPALPLEFDGDSGSPETPRYPRPYDGATHLHAAGSLACDAPGRATHRTAPEAPPTRGVQLLPWRTFSFLASSSSCNLRRSWTHCCSSSAALAQSPWARAAAICC